MLNQWHFRPILALILIWSIEIKTVKSHVSMIDESRSFRNASRENHWLQRSHCVSISRNHSFVKLGPFPVLIGPFVIAVLFIALGLSQRSVTSRFTMFFMQVQVSITRLRLNPRTNITRETRNSHLCHLSVHIGSSRRTVGKISGTGGQKHLRAV